jgi:hypothetical protein
VKTTASIFRVQRLGNPEIRYSDVGKAVPALVASPIRYGAFLPSDLVFYPEARGSISLRNVDISSRTQGIASYIDSKL